MAVQNGQPNGPVVWYYPNGAQKETARYVQGRPLGSKILFDSTGKPLERHVYDTTGRLFLVQGYDKQGCPLSTSLLPLVNTPDTVPVGHSFAGSIRFGYALKHPAVLLVGTLVRGGLSYWKTALPCEIIAPFIKRSAFTFAPFH